jgi:hypothetical protein
MNRVRDKQQTSQIYLGLWQTKRKGHHCRVPKTLGLGGNSCSFRAYARFGCATRTIQVLLMNTD